MFALRLRLTVIFQAIDVLPLCEPLLTRICVELPVLNFSVRVHAAVFEAHGSIALLPCGEFTQRRFYARLAALRSGCILWIGLGFVSSATLRLRIGHGV